MFHKVFYLFKLIKMTWIEQSPSIFVRFNFPDPIKPFAQIVAVILPFQGSTWKLILHVSKSSYLSITLILHYKTIFCATAIGRFNLHCKLQLQRLFSCTTFVGMIGRVRVLLLCGLDHLSLWTRILSFHDRCHFRWMDVLHSLYLPRMGIVGE